MWLSRGCWEGAVLFRRACFECSVLFCFFVVGLDLIDIPVLIDMLVRSFARSLFHVFFFFFRTYVLIMPSVCFVLTMLSNHKLHALDLGVPTNLEDS